MGHIARVPFAVVKVSTEHARRLLSRYFRTILTSRISSIKEKKKKRDSSKRIEHERSSKIPKTVEDETRDAK